MGNNGREIMIGEYECFPGKRHRRRIRDRFRHALARGFVYNKQLNCQVLSHSLGSKQRFNK